MAMTPFTNPAVAQIFGAYPPPVRLQMLALRELIFKTATNTPGVGPVQETLKWGEPAYLTAQSKSGSTVRMDWKKKQPDQIAMYFNCQTTLVETFKTLFPKDFHFEGNRAIVFKLTDTVPMNALSFCVAAALMYHRNKG